MDSSNPNHRYDRLHDVDVSWNTQPHPETDILIRDLVAVESSAHQTMVIVGPWFEARIAHLIRQWLPAGWTTSGPSQVFDPELPGIRSRSWDVVVHRQGIEGLPPESSPGAGYAVLPKSDVAVVIDTKTHFSSPRTYASKPVFNLMNDAEQPQLDFLGAGIRKILLIARSNRSHASLSAEGSVSGIETFCLARMSSSPASDGVDRKIDCVLSAPENEVAPLDAFRQSIMHAVRSWPG